MCVMVLAKGPQTPSGGGVACVESGSDWSVLVVLVERRREGCGAGQAGSGQRRSV